MDLSGHPSCRSLMVSLCLYLDGLVSEIDRSVASFKLSVRETPDGSITTIETSVMDKQRSKYRSVITRTSSLQGVSYTVKEKMPFLVNIVPSDSTLELWIKSLILECISNYPPSSGFDVVYSVFDKIETVTPVN